MLAFAPSARVSQAGKAFRIPRGRLISARLFPDANATSKNRRHLEFEGTLPCGLHLMRLMYAAFKRVAPEHEVQMDLNDPFLTALQVYRKRDARK